MIPGSLDDIFTLLAPVEPAWVLPLVFTGMTVAVTSLIERRAPATAVRAAAEIGGPTTLRPAPVEPLAAGGTSATEQGGEASVDLRVELLAALSDARRDGSAGDARLELAVPPDLICPGDPALLRAVLLGLLRNAIEHAPDGLVFIGAMRAERQTRLIVIDDGTHAAKPLGAAVRRPLARLLATSAASLVVDHRPGDGTTVVLCLPDVG